MTSASFDNGSVTYSYDRAGHITALNNSVGTASRGYAYEYDRAGNQTKKTETGNGNDKVTVILPKKDPGPIEFNISYKRGSFYIAVPEADVYYVVFEAEEDGEVVSFAKMKVTVDAPGESPVVYPKSLKFTGTVTATLCDREMNGICTVKCEA